VLPALHLSGARRLPPSCWATAAHRHGTAAEVDLLLALTSKAQWQPTLLGASFSGAEIALQGSMCSLPQWMAVHGAVLQ